METKEQRAACLEVAKEVWNKVPQKDREAVLDAIYESMERIKKTRKDLKGLAAFDSAFSILVYSQDKEM